MPSHHHTTNASRLIASSSVYGAGHCSYGFAGSSAYGWWNDDNTGSTGDNTPYSIMQRSRLIYMYKKIGI